MISFEALLTHLLNGLAYGLLLFLLAAGLSLIFGMMDVINLSHGSFFMIGGFIGIGLVGVLESFWLALLATVLIVALLGLVVEVALLRPLYYRSHLDQILLTFGLALILEDGAEWIWGTRIQSLRVPEALTGSVEIFGAVVPVYRLAVLAAGVLLGAALWYVLERTRLGSIIRAGVADREMTAALGFNIPVIFAGVFVFGVALAAFAGFMAAPILGVYPGLDFQVLILALIIVVIGGLGSLTGAFWVSLLIGVTQSFGQAYFPAAAAFILYLIMAAVLLLRPEGLFKRRYA
ncbi:branched-chain amino acid ABC transporter permease [Rubrobacter taiwanensis]|jgi:branched-subunit amino acid ABC-type transport system permease component|uniref:Branched-chain amino acid ABC transporter permease n=1 Tax=Rubrobacter taiwanensis TaxID=185139 RepID=A0A4V2NVU2_9ACTN|nr:branched-chain amino acid ABC transporter permease [Rubrobacter taiwanensis]TCJ14842.1 branched-chain amino acid ABC transporter permease [Rubrobacter taiwanensis]